TALPLHLCNAALIIGLFAMIFKSKKLFYFTYFVNVLGAILALVMPDTSGSIFLEGNIRFWLTHITVILVPILAVAWDVFPRPNIKMMRNSIIVFTLYFIVACVSNMLISNVDPNVNYFFLQNDFFIKKFPWAYDIRASFVAVFTIGNLTLTMWPMYWLIIYLVYIAAMFVIWLVYAYIYQISDNIKKIKEFEKIDKLNLRKFKKEILKGRKLSEPINEESIDLLEIKNFTKIYGNSKIPAVDNFSLVVNKGEVFGFLGHNGAGKSTLIKSIVGVQSITKGSITICGYSIEHQPLQAKLNIGYVSDNHAVYEKLTGRDYINFVADLYLVSKEDRDKRLEKYAKLFNLEKDIDRQIKGYSHGMKQKLVVIASIIHNPKVWVLDEPLTGLDPMSAHQIKSLMRDMADQGNIVFFSSHVIEVVEKICDKIAIIAKGKIKGVFNLKDLESNDISLEELYLSIQENPNIELNDKIKKLSLYKEQN
ncbi:MAG: YwaF family protein, partial [Clostridia bacterium]|nr:YwaF family protein [Clostridia bacterium]